MHLDVNVEKRVYPVPRGLEWQKYIEHVIQLAIGYALELQSLLKKVISHVKKKIAAWFH